MAGTNNGTGTQALDRAALLVSTVVHADEPMSFVDLQDECGLPKSTTSRLLSALERTELLERDASGCYVAGPLFWLYAARHDPWEEMARLARPTMEALGEGTMETVNLAVPRGGRVVHVAQVDSRYMLGTRDWTQVDVPPHASALGKVLLAHGAIAPDEAPVTLTERTRTGDALARDLREVRRRGWAATVDELEPGLTGVAVPVAGSAGDVVAALGVSGPTQRLEDRLEELGGSLTEHSERLSALLRRKTRTKDDKEGVA